MTSAGGLASQKLCALPRDRQFVRIGYYKIKPEVAFYSLPQSLEQTKKTMNSTLFLQIPSPLWCLGKIEKEVAADGYCQERCQCGFVITSCCPAAPIQFLSLVSSMAWVLSMHNTEGNGNWVIMGNLVIERNHSNSSTNIKIPIPIQTRITMSASSHSTHYFQFRLGNVKEFLPQFNHKSFLRV